MAATVIGPKPLHEESEQFIQSKLTEHVPRFAQGTDQQAGNLVGALESIIEHKLWRYAGCDSLADYARKYLGHSDTWCREVVRIFMEDWSVEQRKAGTISDLSKAAEQAAKARAQADPESGEFVNPKGGRPKKDETVSNAYGCSDSERNSKPGILRRLARERPDLLERFERGELTANAAAIEAGFRKPPKPRPTTPLELLDYAGEVLKTDSRIGTLFELMNALSPAELQAAKRWLHPSKAA